MHGGPVGSRVQAARRTVVRLVASLLSGAALVGAVPSGVASAHATIDAIAPADGTLLATAPSEVRITFSEPISDRFIEVEFVSTPAAPVTPPAAHRQPGEPTVLVVALPAVGDGLHQLSFSVRDAEDLHEVRGRTSFAIGDDALAVASPPAVAGPGLPESAARWCFAAGLMLVAGVLVMRSVAHRVPLGAPDRLRALTWSGLGAIVVGRIGVLVARALDLGSGLVDGLAVVATTGEMSRLPGVALATACLATLAAPRRWSSLDIPIRRSGSISFRVGLGWLGFGWLALLAAWGDHAALLGPVEPTIALAKAVHLGAMAVWVGVLIVGITANVGREPVLPTLRAASGVAIMAALATAASGLVLTGRTVVSITGLLATTFGNLLVVKTVLLVAVTVIGVGHRTVRRACLATTEAVLLVAVAALGTAMATAGPATDDAFLAAPSDVSPSSLTSTVGDLIVRSRAVPGRPGPNDLELSVTQSRRPAAPIESVDIEATTTSGVMTSTAVPDERGVIVVTDVDLAEGESVVRLVVHRTSRDDVSAAATVSARPVVFHHDPIVSSEPIRTPVRVLALVVVAAAAGVIIDRRRRIRATVPARPS